MVVLELEKEERSPRFTQSGVTVPNDIALLNIQSLFLDRLWCNPEPAISCCGKVDGSERETNEYLTFMAVL